ncbi:MULTISPECIES: hypothetical protein [Streptosporangium]|uniref:Uncharacterized protein n=1 Tax=Streptosporangium brasiliense TaxID=47480 RepID=A0ABT9RFG0_9ACTN|nr:hypothetical protein [Streptosporangium brasiliense]MDP9868032.1 hypothetical protein [Streptosporangium brasiliense]
MTKIWRILLVSALLSLPGVTATEPARAVAAQQPAVQRKVLVELRRQGGFAGFDDRVIVYTDGCARLSRRTGPAVDKCLTRGEMGTLRGYLKRLRLGRSEARPQGADFLKYTIAYRGHRVSRYTLPGSWSPVVRHLEKLLDKYWAPD